MSQEVPEKLHIKAYWCNEGGWLDFGSLPTEEAIVKVAELIKSGNGWGGCRCKRGWFLAPCPKAEHDCTSFDITRHEDFDSPL